MVKISACVIVKNEEDNILQWLSNVKQFADEILVVDTGSTDRTLELLQSSDKTMRIFHFTWCDDFAAARNFAIEKATGQWIVFLDADEYFTDDTIDMVRPIVEKYHRDIRKSILLCKLWNLDKDNDYKRIDSCLVSRVFRNSRLIRYEGEIHEALINTNPKAERQFQMVDLEINHTGYSSQIVRSKIIRNTAIIHKRMTEKGAEPRDYYYLIDEYFRLAAYEKVIAAAKEVIKAKLWCHGAEGKAYNAWLDSLVMLGRPLEEQREIADKAIEFWPKLSMFYFRKGNICYAMQDYEAALVAYTTGMDRQCDNSDPLLSVARDTAARLLPQVERNLFNIMKMKGL